MPRSNRRDRSAPAGESLSLERVLGGGPRRVSYAGEDWFERRLGGRLSEHSSRAYRCPGCSQQLDASSPHVVVWPADPIGAIGGVEDRRHWHTSCWTHRDRRPPTGSYR